MNRTIWPGQHWTPGENAVCRSRRNLAVAVQWLDGDEADCWFCYSVVAMWGIAVFSRR